MCPEARDTALRPAGTNGRTVLTLGKAVARGQRGKGAAGAVAPRCPPRVGAARVPSLVKLTKLHDCDRCNFPQQTHRERVRHASDQVETKLKARFPPRRTAILADPGLGDGKRSVGPDRDPALGWAGANGETGRPHTTGTREPGPVGSRTVSSGGEPPGRRGTVPPPLAGGPATCPEGLCLLLRVP